MEQRMMEWNNHEARRAAEGTDLHVVEPYILGPRAAGHHPPAADCAIGVLSYPLRGPCQEQCRLTPVGTCDLHAGVLIFCSCSYRGGLHVQTQAETLLMIVHSEAG